MSDDGDEALKTERGAIVEALLAYGVECMSYGATHKLHRNDEHMGRYDRVMAHVDRLITMARSAAKEQAT